MTGMDAFSRLHPAVGFIYFLCVTCFAAFFVHPAAVACSCAASLAYAVCLRRASGLRFCLGIALPAFVLVTVINPIFNHSGATVLAYFPSGNPLTYESLIYGAAAAGMMASVLQWFYCISAVMTSDKLICLFGRAAPSLGLLLSMTLRLVGRFSAKYKSVYFARSVGKSCGKRRKTARVRAAAAATSATVTWALENSAETADAMKSRGYGLPGRTSFTVFRFTLRDAALLSSVLLMSAAVVAGIVTGAAGYGYFPRFSAHADGILAAVSLGAYSVLCFLPVLMYLTEAAVWKYSRRRI